MYAVTGNDVCSFPEDYLLGVFVVEILVYVKNKTPVNGNIPGKRQLIIKPNIARISRYTDSTMPLIFNILRLSLLALNPAYAAN